ncbi:hypothetical protein BX600DRAFT_508402 [Xylariales sp. PMI_506]|nr:hypothetical protein BX600DRAFT_508402 [Xylariales sp. PMI_506]
MSNLHDRGSPLHHGQSPRASTPRTRQPIGLKAAFKLAEEQEEREKSDGDSTFDLKQAFNMANAEVKRAIQGSPSPAPRSYRRRESEDLRSNQYFTGAGKGDLDQHLEIFDRNHQLTAGAGPLDGLFTTRNNRNGAEVNRFGGTSNSHSASQTRRPSQGHGDLQEKLPTDTIDWEKPTRRDVKQVIEFAPLPPVEFPTPGSELAAGPLGGFPIARPATMSPEKSYNWHLDADFTAGDLQISDSPRIKLGKNKGSTAGDSPISDSSHSSRGNNRLQQIRELEVAAKNAIIRNEDASPALTRRQSRLDEIRVLEMEAASKRAVAKSRLDEIRAKNSEARSRSDSPEASSKGSNKSSPRPGSTSPHNLLDKRPSKTSPGPTTMTGEAIPGTPVTIFRSSKQNGKDEKFQDGINARSEDDSHELLRRLARATSQSPPPAQDDAPKAAGPALSKDTRAESSSDTREQSRPRLAREDRQHKELGAKNSRDRLTVGFAGLHKGLASEALQEKRRSLAHSDSDPTDRIEAEMKLFAPLDNYSERGSIRAPSPMSEKSEPVADETPRPAKQADPLTQPTPRVIGAYVDTPATVKVEKRDEAWVDVKSEDDSLDLPASSSNSRDKEALSGDVKAPIESKSIKAPNGDASDKVAKVSGRSSSVPAGRRARSTSKRRRRPLINTAKIPTVKEDLRAIIEQHRLDDSTLDDFDELLANVDVDDEDLQNMVDDTVLKFEEDLALSGLTDRERELQAFDRMSKSLKTGLLGIRSAKQGIERLEDKVTHSEQKTPSADNLTMQAALASLTKAQHHLGSTESTFYISMPHLYRREPKFKLTLFGLLSLLFALWYAVESYFCFHYVVPYDCPPNRPCDWSPNEPYFPYATPFMLDEWVTGGDGREIVWRIGQEIGDIMAEASDWVTGHDFTKDEEMYMNVWARKRHRRRLKKRGLNLKWVEPPEFKEKFRSWREAWKAREQAIERGEALWGDESMSADERI